MPFTDASQPVAAKSVRESDSLCCFYTYPSSLRLVGYKKIVDQK